MKNVLSHIRLSAMLQVTLGLLLATGGGPAAAMPEVASAPPPDLLVHYTFDQAPNGTAKDHGVHGHDGQVVGAQYHEELDGRHGVLRFDGISGKIDLGSPEALEFAGDMTVEMWARLHGPVDVPWGFVFGEYPIRSFYLTYAQYHTFMLWYRGIDGKENMIESVDANFLNDQWAHLAVVVEYPRCRFYRNGELVRDAYMPIEGIAKLLNRPKFIAGSPKGGNHVPLDLDEFRWYRRALSAEEVAAHAQGRETNPVPTHELAVETNWYEDVVTLRLNSKGGDFSDHIVRFQLFHDGKALVDTTADIEEAYEGSGRYVATVTLPLEQVEGRTLQVVGRLTDPHRREVANVTQTQPFEKPDWVDSPAGTIKTVPEPWTAVRAEQDDDQVSLGVWGRRHVLSTGSVIDRIDIHNEELLADPITLTAASDGKPVAWQARQIALAQADDVAATVKQTRHSRDLTLTLESTIEFDGYLIVDCQLQAKRDIELDELTLDIPLRREFAGLCYGDRVLSEKPGIPISGWYSGSVEENLAFHFGPTIWLGNHERGLTWQAESNEHWHNADPERAIEILPRDQRTVFRAHFVDKPTQLSRGESLHYRFALQAMPIKPMGASAWDLRIIRTEPWGKVFHYPDRTTAGQSTLDYLREQGVRRLFFRTADVWPYPMPQHETFAAALQRFIDTTNESGLKLHPYLLHQRYPVVVPEYDAHGLHMALRPQATYLQAVNGPHDQTDRPGPIGTEWGAGAQGCVFACPKSMALQDSYLHSLAQRVEVFGEDGIYLDGTGQIPPCNNTLHGCGYHDDQGRLQATYPVFAVRRYLQRIHQIVKQPNPDNIVDIHCSWGYNPAALAYGDVMWTGEQWFHLRHNGAEHIPDELSFEMFQTEFLGHQIGIAAEALSYRLGPRMQVSAVSLLHDVPVRVTNRGLNAYLADPNSKPDDNVEHFLVTSKLWKLRDRFEVNESEKFFYWQNADLIQLSPRRCHALIFKHPENGVLLFVTNLSRENHEVQVQLNLEHLGLTDADLEAFDALNDHPLPLSPQGELSLPLDSLDWTYVWVRPVSQP